MRSIEKKKGQQELVGFVLIVILVVVALMVFLVISLKKPVVSAESKSTESMLSAIMAYTTDCVVAEPRRETVRDLIEDAYNGEKCVNLNRMIRDDYLNEVLLLILNDLQRSDATISSFQMYGYWENDQENQQPDDIFSIGSKCAGGLRGESSPIYVNSGQINVVLELCSEQAD